MAQCDRWSLAKRYNNVRIMLQAKGTLQATITGKEKIGIERDSQTEKIRTFRKAKHVCRGKEEAESTPHKSSENHLIR